MQLTRRSLSLFTLACALIVATHAPLGLAQTGAESACFDAVQGTVAWNQAGNTSWNDANVRRLCEGTTSPAATIACFEGQIARHDDWDRAISACAGTNVATPSPVTLYQHCSFGGYAVELDEGPFDMQPLIGRGIRNDDVSAIKVAPGYSVTLYEHANYQGRSWTFTADDDCFVDNGLNDVVSSLRVARTGTQPSPPALAGYELEKNRILEGAIWQTLNNVASVGACAQRCDGATGCRSFTYIPSRNICELKRSAAFQSGTYSGYVSGIKTSSSRPDPTPVGYDVREGRILEGAIWQTLNNVASVGACAQRCDGATGCRSFTYIPSRNICELKRSAAFQSGTYSGYVSGIKTSSSRPDPTPVGYDVREGRILEGAIWQTLNNVASVGACAQRCDGATGCRSFTYIPSRNICELKRSAAFQSGTYSGYVSGVSTAAPPEPKTIDLPSGVLELRHEAGYVADFYLNWLEPQTIAGNEILIPKTWTSGNVTLGWSDVVVFPPGSRNVTLTIEKFNFIAITETFYTRTFEEPPNQCLKIWNTVGNPKWGACSDSDFTEGLRRATAFFRENERAISMISDHLKQRGDGVNGAIGDITAQRYDAAARRLDIQGLVTKLERANLASAAPAIILASPNGREAVYRPGENAGRVESVANLRVNRNKSLFQDLGAITLTVGSNITAVTGISSGVGAAFATRGDAVRSVTGIEAVNWQVCCGIGASAGLTLGFWRKEPLDLSGVGWGISGSLGYIGGATVTAWADYDKGNSFGGTGSWQGMEISADFTTPSADFAYIRGWTCAFADRNQCTGLMGN